VGVSVLPWQGSHVEGSFGHWGVRKVIKEDKNQTIALAVGTKAVTQSGMGSRASVLKTAGCASRDKMVYWRCLSNISGYQLYDR
jgi:hypothetical protein